MENRGEYIVLNGKNWASWKFQISVILKSKKLYGVVTGDETKPENADSVQVYEEKDCKAQEIIVTRVNENVLTYLSSCHTSSEMWKKLFTLYEPSSQVSVHLVQQKFFNMSFEEPVMKFISNIEEVCSQLRNFNEAPSEKMIITKILLTLPEKYRHFVSAWESVPEGQQCLKELTSRLLVEEERCNQSEPTASSSAFVSRSGFQKKKQNNSDRKCFECGKSGHIKSECRQRKCFNCNRVGHISRDCRSKIKHKNDVSVSKENNNSEVVNMRRAFIVQEPVCQNDLDFIMDTGASEHMSYNRKLFSSYRKINKQVVVGDGKRLKVEGIGDINFLAFDGSEYVPSVMCNVLFVPDLKANLFSPVRAIDRGNTVLTNESECKFLYKNKVVAQAKRIGSLYVMDFKFNINEDCAFLSLSSWHERLAHQNFKHVKEILNKNNVKYEGQIEQCRSCVQGKQHRLPFSNSDSRAERPGELVHGDLCGAMETKSLGGSSYFLLLKDDYSNFRYVYFLKNKYETKQKIAEFIEQFENEFECKIKRFRSDGGGEFKNKDVEKLFKMKGIVHEVTVAYTPEQNGRIEREMRTIVESARTMLINANVSNELWAEAVHNAVYTINRTGTSPQKCKTPYELLYKKDFNINVLRTFGDEVYVHIPKQRRRKWDPKGKLGRFVGYGGYTKGYRVWFEDEKAVDTFRDVIFMQDSRKSEKKIKHTENIISVKEDFNTEEEKQSLIQKDMTVEEEQVKSREEMPNITEEQEEVPDDEYKDVEENNKSDIENEGWENNSDLDAIYEEEYLEDEWLSSDDAMTKEEQTRSGRRVKKPKWTEDYETGLLALGEEELSYKEAVNGKDKEKWMDAINKELEALEKNNTWIETDLPTGKKAIDSKWVFKIKKDGNEEIYKARLVARGFKQKEKFDHSEVYAPVAKLPTLRILLAIACKYDLDIQQMDVKSAFLNGKIDEEVYLEKPDGMKKNGKVLKLRKSLYGLKKSPRYWNQRFDELMLQQGFLRSKSDYCLYYKRGQKFYILLYVDDIILISENREEIDKIKEVLKNNFDMKDMHGVSKYLGIKIKKTESGIELDQEEYLKEILKKFGMENCKPVSTPIEPGLELSKEASKDEKLIRECRQLIGSLMYAMLATRPDLCYAVSFLARYQTYADERLWKALKRVLRYIKGTVNYKLVYRKNGEEVLKVFTDADWAGEKLDRKSTSGFIVKVFGCTVSWSSSKQQCVALSSTESEYVALAKGVAEGCWVKNLLNEVCITCNCFRVFVDNLSAIHIAKNPEQHKRLKHIDLKYHYIRDRVANNIVVLEHIDTNKQIADVLTKALSKERFNRCCSQL